MRLKALLKPWIQTITDDCEITGLQNDSRFIKHGDLFLAYPGAQTDGRHFISEAMKAGAHAVLYDALNWTPCVFSPACSGISIDELEKKLADIASRFYGEPTQFLSFTGVTGTNGKTTIAYQLAQAYELLGQSSAYVGTLGQGKPLSLKPLNNTTPDALVLQALFHQYHNAAIKQVCMEVSSHALTQHRVEHIPFKQAIFTNLTHDHLDYHQTIEAYAQAKSSLFAIPSLEYAVINQDDVYCSVMKSKTPNSCQIISYGIHHTADVFVRAWEVNLKGTTMEVHSPWGVLTLKINALGFFNLYNALAIFSSLLVAGYKPDVVVPIMGKLKPAPGRMEVVAQDPTVIVDYAHTPDALENVLATLNKLKVGRLLVVFGCGGDRDKLKRPIMGKIASQYADWVCLTSDNPRHEDPEQILNEIAVGISDNTVVERICDRESAILRALAVAQKNDIVVIAGKGHEVYQQIGNQRFPFSDQEIVRHRLTLDQSAH